MTSAALRLGELVCARLCHDLGGLLGALAGSLHLAEEDRGGGALALAREMADALVRRLRLLRAALGPASERLDAGGIADLAAGLGERLRVDASALGPEPLAAERARLALAMLLLGAEALPRGGTLRLAVEAGGVLSVTADGLRAAWPPDITQGLAAGLADAPPDALRALLAFYCALLARDARSGLAAEGPPPVLRAVPLARIEN